LDAQHAVNRHNVKPALSQYTMRREKNVGGHGSL